MSTRILVWLLVALTAESMALVYGLNAIALLEENGGLPLQTSSFADGARAFLIVGTAAVAILSVFGVEKMRRNKK